MEDFLIYEGDWLQGEGSKNSYLYRIRDKKECCLGQYAEFCGIPFQQLAGYQTLTTVYNNRPIEQEHMLEAIGWTYNTGESTVQDSMVAREMMDINDHPLGEDYYHQPYDGSFSSMTLELKKELLIKCFAKVGVTTVFVPGHRPR